MPVGKSLSFGDLLRKETVFLCIIRVLNNDYTCIKLYLEIHGPIKKADEKGATSMDRLKGDLFLRILERIPASEIYGQYIFLSLDDQGAILSVGDKWSYRFTSIIDTLERFGNIFECFDLSPFHSLSEMPFPKQTSTSSDPGDLPEPFVFFNSQPFPRAEDTEQFFTTLPTVQLAVGRLEKSRFYGIVRTRGIIPEIFADRPNCVVHLDKKERLVGFSETFFSFFASKYKNPQALMLKPANLFVSPTPLQIQTEALEKTPCPPESAFREIYRNPFDSDADLERIRPSAPNRVRRIPQGLSCTNEDYNPLILRLPEAAGSGDDFMVEIDFSAERGDAPLFYFGGEVRDGRFTDRHGYMIGTQYKGKAYLLKKRGYAQCTGSAAALKRWNTLAFCKIGNTFRLMENGVLKLAYSDPNLFPLFNGEPALGIRHQSHCVIRRISLKVLRSPSRARPGSLPLVVLNTPEQNAFILNRLNTTSFSSNYPDIAMYMLDNVSEIKRDRDLLEQGYRRLLLEKDAPQESFICESPVLMSLKRKAATVAASDASILLQGETGTGKDVLARFIHANSLRREAPFIKVDCSTIPFTLMESELFGHERGAFTGALDRKIGFFEQANGGTLFLDEVANIPQEVQAKLLRFLQDRVIVRIGGEGPIHLDARIIAASNAPLPELVKAGKFRSDLFYRLEVVTLTLPPLRERVEDIPPLCHYFLSAFNARHNKHIRELSGEAYRKIMDYGWPGNIRELRNMIERAVIFCDQEVITPEMITLSSGRTAPANARPARSRKQRQILQADPELIKALFQKHRGVARKVAEELNVSFKTLYNWINKNGLSIGAFRTDATL